MKRIVIALGGNALGDNPKEQLAQINQAAPAMVEMIKLGYEIIISHGNGPQVGMLEKAINLAANLDSSIPHVELPECTAMSQGYIGYHLQNALYAGIAGRELLDEDKLNRQLALLRAQQASLTS